MDQQSGSSAHVPVRLVESPAIRFGPLTVRPALRSVTHDDGRNEILEPRVMQVLVALLRAEGGVVTRDDLVESCWDGRIVGEDAIIRTISRLRRLAEGMGWGVFRIETLSKIGYRLVAETASECVNVRSAVPPAPRRTVRWQWSALGALLLAALAAAAILLRPRERGGSARLVMVEQLRAAPSDHDAQLLRQSLSSDLSRIVIDSDTTLDFVDPSDVATTRSRADFAITGEARTDADRLDTVVRLVDSRNAIILWSRGFSGAAGDVDRLRLQMATHIGDVLTCALGARARRHADIDVATLRLFLAGCENWHFDWPAARAYFGKVTARRPDFAQARAMYAAMTAITAQSMDTHDRVRLLRESVRDAEAALAQDPHIGVAYAVLADGLDDGRDWAEPGAWQRWSRRYTILQKGIAAAPDSYEVQTELNLLLRNAGLMRAALTHAERAAALDPFAPIFLNNLASAYVLGSRMEDAERLLRRAHENWPQDFGTSWTRFETAARIGDAAEAIAMLDQPGRNPGYAPPRPALWRLFLDARLHPTAPTIERARAAFVAAGAATPEMQAKIEIVAHLVQMGKLDDAFGLAMTLPPIAGGTGFNWFYGYMAPFRADPRFLAFAERQGMYAIWVHMNRWPDFCATERLPYDCRRGLALSRRAAGVPTSMPAP